MSAVVSPDETLHKKACCPSTECKLLDFILSKAFEIATCMGFIGNYQVNYRGLVNPGQTLGGQDHTH